MSIQHLNLNPSFIIAIIYTYILVLTKFFCYYFKNIFFFNKNNSKIYYKQKTELKKFKLF